MEGKCDAPPERIASNLDRGLGLLVDGVYAYPGVSVTSPTWTRVRLSDHKVEAISYAKAFAPAAVDGTTLYGCAGAPGLPGAPCEVRRREGDGPETSVTTLKGPLWRTLAVRGDTLYWARAASTSDCCVADIVALNLVTKVERVLARGEDSPFQIIVDDRDVYWLCIGDAGIRKVPLDGGVVTSVAGTATSSGFTKVGDVLFVASLDGVLRVSPSGAPPERVLRGGGGRSPTLGADDADAVAVRGDELLWTARSSSSAVVLFRRAVPRGAR